MAQHLLERCGGWNHQVRSQGAGDVASHINSYKCFIKVVVVGYRQYDLRESSKRSEVLIDLTEFCGQLVEAKCLAVNPRDNNYLAVGANGPFVRLYDIRMIHNYRLDFDVARRQGLHGCLLGFSRFSISGFSFSSRRKSVLQGTSAAVHTFCERQKPIPDGAGQYYVAGAVDICNVLH